MADAKNKIDQLSLEAEEIDKQISNLEHEQDVLRMKRDNIRFNIRELQRRPNEKV